MNRKAQHVTIVTLGVFVMFILSTFVILTVTGDFTREATGSTVAVTCERSIETKASWDEKIDSAADKVYIDTCCAGIGCANKGIRRTGIYGTGCLPAAKELIWGNAKTVNEYNSKAADGMKDLMFEVCHENSNAKCIGDAAKVSECLYDYAAKTFYGLKGGVPGVAKIKNDVGDPFNLYAINVTIKEPETITIQNIACTDLVRPTVTERCGTPLCVTNSGPNACNVTMDRVDEQLMRLTMISICQEHGYDSPACLCFIDEDTGASVGNGLPMGTLRTYASGGSSNFFQDQATLENINYGTSGTGTPKGCGFSPSQVLSLPQITDSSMIVWGVRVGDPSDTTAYQLRVGDSVTLYTRLTKDGKKVVIADDQDTEYPV